MSFVEDAWDGATEGIGDLFGGVRDFMGRTAEEVAEEATINAIASSAAMVAQRGGNAVESAGSQTGDFAGEKLSNEWVSRAVPMAAVFTPEGRANLAGDLQTVSPMLNAYVPGASMVINNLLPIAAQQGLFGDVGQNPPPRKASSGGGVVGSASGGGGGMGAGMGAPGGFPAWVIPVAVVVLGIGFFIATRK